MRRNYLFLTGVLFLMLLAVSCKKDHKVQPQGAGSGTGGLATLGLYESVSGILKQLLMPVTGVGTQSVYYRCIFDTGSAGLVMDAHGILPSSMISDDGIQVDGDSVTVNGITVTSRQLSRSYGNKEKGVTEYGNLAYAIVTIGDQNGSMKTGRIPFFLYYKVADSNTGENLPEHSSDVFGVAPGFSPNFGEIQSPLSYLNFGSGLTPGFKLATLNSDAFKSGQNYVPGLLTIGLTPADLNSSGFVIAAFPQGGSSPYVYGDIVFDGNEVIAATIEFDTGNPAYSIIESYAQQEEVTLSEGKSVKLSTYGGFSYQYTTASSANRTNIASPQITDDVRSNFGIDFFLHNEYLIDYANHKIGLKNN